jgi:peptidoglycan/LPS O-acetylase OafA/YrhL
VSLAPTADAQREARLARLPGLDLLRALAIVLVFVYHYRIFVSPQPDLGWTSVVGWVGVDLFFVLSGYLISNQLLAGVLRGQTLSLKAFYLRRALRTWPAFWLVLAAYFIWPAAMGGRTPPPLWRFLSFTQNWSLPPGTAFSHAWSLCIEEQFYLVLPLVLLLAWRVGGGVHRAWISLGLFWTGAIVARGVLWAQYGREDFGQISGYHAHIYYATLCRIDEFLPGVAVALLKHKHPMRWQRITAHPHAVTLAALLGSGLMLVLAHGYYVVDGYGYFFFMTTFGYSLIAMSFALLVIAALSPGSALQRLQVPGAYRLALWSYSIYLSHKAVGNLMRAWLQPLGLSATLSLICITVVSVAVGAVLYVLVEAPFMRWRERLAPGSFVAA